MLAFHPTISLRTLVKAPSSSAKDVESRAAALFPSHTITLTDSGRSALAVIIETLGLAGKRVALPAYLCDNLLPVLTAYDITPVFLDIVADFRPDIAAYSASFDAAIVVATYGKDPDMTHINYLKNRGALVIEDFAHVPLPMQPVSHINGDARYYSLPKIMPAPQGGLAVLADRKTNKISRRSHASIKDTLKLLSFFAWAITLLRLLLSYRPTQTPRWNGIHALSGLSRRLLSHHLTHRTAVETVGGFRYCYPLFFKNPARAQRKAIFAGIAAERIWEKLIIDAADVERGKFSNADAAASRVLCVPLWHLKSSEEVARFERRLQNIFPDDFAGFGKE